jgi:sorting nexin-41/42
MIDYAQDHMELGAIWNGFSLNESGELAASIEKTGQAIDTTYMSTTRLVSLEPTSLVESNANWQRPIAPRP